MYSFETIQDVIWRYCAWKMEPPCVIQGGIAVSQAITFVKIRRFSDDT